MNTKERDHNANKLKSLFNLMWDKSVEQGGGELSYRDMNRIADAIRAEGPEVLELESLPAQINSGLEFAISVVDPNKASSKEHLKKGIAGLGGAGGVALIAVCLGQLLNPGVIAVAIAFFGGGIAGGPLAVVGIGAGLVVLLGSIYAAYQKMSPKERAVKAHEFVTKGIDQWAKDDKSDSESSKETSEVIESAKVPELSERFDQQDLEAACVILNQVAQQSGGHSPKRSQFIEDAVGGPLESDLTFAESLARFAAIEEDRRKEIAAWCFGVAHSDDQFTEGEESILREVCRNLKVDYDSFVGLFEGTPPNTTVAESS